MEDPCKRKQFDRVYVNCSGVQRKKVNYHSRNFSELHRNYPVSLMNCSLHNMNGIMQQGWNWAYVITRNFILVLVKVIVIALLPDFMCFQDSSAAMLLHAMIFYLVFIGADRAYMRYTDRDIAEFDVLCRLPFNEVAAFSNCLLSFLWPQDTYTYVIRITAFPNTLCFWDFYTTSLLHPMVFCICFHCHEVLIYML